MTRSTLWIPAAASLLALNVAATVVLVTRVSPDAVAAPAPHAAVADHAAEWKIRTGISGGDLVVIVSDKVGSPIGDAHVSVTPTGAARSELTLQGMAYRGSLPVGKGHHDVTIVVERGGARYVQYSSVDVP